MSCRTVVEEPRRRKEAEARGKVKTETRGKQWQRAAEDLTQIESGGSTRAKQVRVDPTCLIIRSSRLARL